MSEMLDSIRGTDIYLLDQILKDRYLPTDIILDAGCGGGRNMKWFLSEGIEIHGCDQDPVVIELLRLHFPELSSRFKIAALDALPYSDSTFDHIICSAVLHFSASEQHFLDQFAELSRVLKKGGILFIRSCTFQGLDAYERDLGSGRYLLKDGSERFVCNTEQLEKAMRSNSLQFLEPPKSVNVNELRSMGVWVLQKA